MLQKHGSSKSLLDKGCHSQPGHMTGPAELLIFLVVTGAANTRAYQQLEAHLLTTSNSGMSDININAILHQQ